MDAGLAARHATLKRGSEWNSSMPGANNTGLLRLHNTFETRTLRGLGEQPGCWRLPNKAAYIFHCGLAALRDRDGDVFHAPSAIQYSRAWHLVGHLKQSRLVGREYVELSTFEHFNCALEVLCRHYGSIWQDLRNGALRRASLGDADPKAGLVYVRNCRDRGDGGDEVSQLKRN